MNRSVKFLHNLQGSLVALANCLAMAHSLGFDQGLKEVCAAPASPRITLNGVLQDPKAVKVSGGEGCLVKEGYREGGGREGVGRAVGGGRGEQKEVEGVARLQPMFLDFLANSVSSSLGFPPKGKQNFVVFLLEASRYQVK